MDAGSSFSESKKCIIFQTHARIVYEREPRGGLLRDLLLCFCFILKLNRSHPYQVERDEGWAKTGGPEQNPDPQVKGRLPCPFNRPCFNEASVQLFRSTPTILDHWPLASHLFFFYLFFIFKSTKLAQQLRQQTEVTKRQPITYWLPACLFTTWKWGFLSKGTFWQLGLGFITSRKPEAAPSVMALSCVIWSKLCYCYWEPVTWKLDFCEWV